jgi:hypothetical protein
VCFCNREVSFSRLTTKDKKISFQLPPQRKLMEMTIAHTRFLWVLYILMLKRISIIQWSNSGLWSIIKLHPIISVWLWVLLFIIRKVLHGMRIKESQGTLNLPSNLLQKHKTRIFRTLILLLVVSTSGSVSRDDPTDLSNPYRCLHP